MLEATSFHPARRARTHLRMAARAGGHDEKRADEVLELVGLTGDAKRKVGGFSMGMRQRLELATALIGDPDVLILDEPSNGLDPQGIAWLRDFMRYLAGEGRTVLVSSHLLAEMAQTIDDAVIVSFGQLKAQGTLEEITAGMTGVVMRARTPEADRLVRACSTQAGIAFRRLSHDEVAMDGVTPEQVGPLLASNQIVLYELTQEGGDLESVFLSLTAGLGFGERGGAARRDQRHARRAAQDALHARGLGHLRPGFPLTVLDLPGRVRRRRRLPGPHLLLRAHAAASGASSSAPATSGSRSWRRSSACSASPASTATRPSPRRSSCVPVRTRVLLAKVVATALWSILIALLTLVAVAAVALPWNAALGGVTSQVTDQVGAVVPGLLASAVLLGLFGLGFGTLVKNQVAAILLTIGGTLILESILIALARAIFHYNLNWLPNGAGAALAGRHRPRLRRRRRRRRPDGFHLLTWWQGGLVMLAWGLVPLTIGYFTTFRRDVT